VDVEVVDDDEPTSVEENDVTLAKETFFEREGFWRSAVG
jgi:hypothetical protein